MLFLSQNKGDERIRKLINKGGNKGVKSIFDNILKVASKPLTSSH